MATPGNGSHPGIGIKPQVSLRKYPKLALLSACLVLLLGTPVALIKGQPYYSADTVIHIAPRYMKTLKEDNELDFQSNSQYRQFVQQQTSSIGRYDIVRDTLASPGLQWRQPAESERQAVERLQQRLQLLPIPDTYMVRITLQGAEKEQLAPVLNRLIQVYQQRVRDEMVYGAKDRISQLEKRQQSLLQHLDKQSERRNAIASELGIATFSTEAGNPYDKAVQALRDSLTEARSKRMDAQARRNAFVGQGDTDMNVRSVTETVLIDPGLNSLKAGLNARRAQLVVTLSGLTPVHPGYEIARQELADIDREINQQETALKNKINSSLRTRHETGVNQAMELENALAAELAEQEKSRARFASLFKEAASLSEDIEQEREELNKVRERLNFFAAEASALGFVRLVTPALPAEMPLGPGKKKLLLLVLLAAMASIVVVPVLRDLMDRNIHSPNDVQQLTGIPPMGWLVAHDGPASHHFYQDQLRRLATALIREQDQHQRRIFGITSIQPGGGSSSLCHDLAATLRQLGFASLAVEANAFKPDPRYASACVHQLCAGDVLPLSADIELLRLQAATDNRNLGGIDYLGHNLRQLAQQHRFVLLDLPPLFVSSDAELLLRDVDGVMLVVEAETLTRGEVSRACRVMQKLDPDAFGIVVNKVRPLDGGGYLQDLIQQFHSGGKAVRATPIQELQRTLLTLQTASREMLRGDFS